MHTFFIMVFAAVSAQISVNILYVVHIILVIPDATVQMADDQYSVGEGDGSVEVCVELTSVPAGGLEFEIEVTLVFTEGTKARKLYRTPGPCTYDIL